jgi:hypothetical protein
MRFEHTHQHTATQFQFPRSNMLSAETTIFDAPPGLEEHKKRLNEIANAPRLGKSFNVQLRQLPSQVFYPDDWPDQHLIPGMIRTQETRAIAALRSWLAIPRAEQDDVVFTISAVVVPRPDVPPQLHVQAVKTEHEQKLRARTTGLPKKEFKFIHWVLRSNEQPMPYDLLAGTLQIISSAVPINMEDRRSQ